MRKTLIFLILCLCAVGYARQEIDFVNMSTVRGTVKTMNSVIDDIDSKILNLQSGQNLGTGLVFYVDSAVGSDTNVGTSPILARATLDAAVALCTANRGDVIYLMQGHAETMGGSSDSVDLDIAGITVIGLGNGADAPTFTYDTATDEFVIGAANVTISNLRFVAGVTSITMGISIEAAGNNFVMANCVFPKPTTNSWEFLDSIDVATGADNILIYGCEAYNDEAGAAPVHFIDAGNGAAGPEKLQMVNNIIKGDFSVSAIWSDEPCDEAFIYGNTITNHTSAQHCIEFTATGTGVIAFNSCFASATATSIDPGSHYCYENYVTTAVDTSGVLYPTPGPVTANEDGNTNDRLEDLKRSSDALLANMKSTGMSIGTVYYVYDSGSGGGTSWGDADTTLDTAVNRCSANNNDIILVASNHNENLSGADAVDIDTAGVSVIGIGQGAARPMFDFDDAAAEIVIGAANVVVENLQFKPGVTLVLKAIDVEVAGDYAVIKNCSIIEGEAAGTDEFVDGIIVGTTATNVTVDGCSMVGTGTEMNSFINMEAATIADLTVKNCYVYGALLEAPIYGAATVPTNVTIANNNFENTSTGQLCIEFTGNATGTITDNLLISDVYGSILDPGLAICSGNKQSVNGGASTEDIPLVKGKSYSRAMLTGDTNATDNLFDVTGGQIIITSCVAKCTVAVGGATVMKIFIDADDTFDYDVTTSVDIDTVDAGGLLTFTAAAGESVLAVQAVGGSGSMGVPIQWWIEEGMMTSTLDSGGSTGDLEWYIIFTPVADGVEVIPQ